MSKAPATTLEQIRASDAQRRADAATRYRELLLRNDSPHAGDAEELAAVAATLNRKPADLEGDLATVQGFVALEAAEQAKREFVEPAAAARRAARAVQNREEDKLTKARERCLATISTAQQEATRVQAKLDAAEAEHGRHWKARDAWTAIVQGISEEEARERRLAASRRSVIRPEPATVESEPMVSGAEAVVGADEPGAAEIPAAEPLEPQPPSDDLESDPQAMPDPEPAAAAGP